MAAITAAVTRRKRNLASKTKEECTVTTAQTVYVGSLVNFVNSTNRVRSATNSTGRKFAGIVEEVSVDPCTGNTGGTVTCTVAWNFEARVACATALSSAYVGANCAISTNNDVTTASAAGTALVQVLCGEVTAKESALVAWVFLRRHAGSGANV